jgi:hypothetical protein
MEAVCSSEMSAKVHFHMTQALKSRININNHCKSLRSVKTTWSTENGHHCFQCKIQHGATTAVVTFAVFLAQFSFLILNAAHDPPAPPVCSHLCSKFSLTVPRNINLKEWSSVNEVATPIYPNILDTGVLHSWLLFHCIGLRCVTAHVQVPQF